MRSFLLLSCIPFLSSAYERHSSSVELPFWYYLLTICAFIIPYFVFFGSIIGGWIVIWRMEKRKQREAKKEEGKPIKSNVFNPEEKEIKEWEEQWKKIFGFPPSYLEMEEGTEGTSQMTGGTTLSKETTGGTNETMK